MKTNIVLVKTGNGPRKLTYFIRIFKLFMVWQQQCTLAYKLFYAFQLWNCRRKTVWAKHLYIWLQFEAIVRSEQRPNS